MMYRRPWILPLTLLLILISKDTLADWANAGPIKQIILDDSGSSDKMYLVFEKPFHQCGWNQAAVFDSSLMLPADYGAVVERAFSGKRTQSDFSVVFQGCSDKRAIGQQLQAN